VQPYLGARDEGVVGAVKGVAKGIAGTPTKFFAGESLSDLSDDITYFLGAAMSGTVGYSLKGVDVAISNASGSRKCNPVVAARLAQGEQECLEASDATKKDIIQRWQACLKSIASD
jgi:hypothetical protein